MTLPAALPTRRPTRRALLLRTAGPVLGACAVVVGGCARPGSPPGGPGDRRPPVVESVEPEPFSLVEPGERTLRVRYNERISERPTRGSLADAVTISPRTGDVRVSHDREGLDIEVEGGLREGLVYRVTIAPTLNDMFANPMAVPFEWVFSTGDSIRPNAIVGQVWDATTGVGVPDATIELRRVAGGDTGAPADTFPYFARADSIGIFALRYLPAGPVELLALQDLDRDGEVDFGEPLRRQRLQLGAADTVTLTNLPLLASDSTRATLEDVEILDSLTLRIEFDDFVDPVSPIEELLVSLSPAVDSTGAVLEAAAGAVAPAVERVFHEAGFVVWADSLAEALDSLAAEAPPAAQEPAAAAITDPTPPDTTLPDLVLPDTLPPDTLAADSVPSPAELLQEETPPEGAARPRTPDQFALDQALDLLPNGARVPQRTIVVRLAEPLPAGVPFDLLVDRIINLSQVAGGGGTLTIERELSEPEEPPPGL